MVWAQTMVGAKMFVYFKTASGKFMRLDVPSSACVADVKRLLAARNPEAVGADPACFHLVFRGHQLAENESFMAAGIRSQQLITVEHRAGATIAAVPASPAARPVHGYTPASAAPELPISAARYTAEGSDAAAEQGIHALAAQSSVPEAMRLGHRLSSSNGSVGYCSACAENQGRLTVFEQRVAAQERELAANARELAASVQAIQAHPQFWLRCSGGAMYGAALAAARKPAVVATDQRRADQELERQQRAVQGANGSNAGAGRAAVAGGGPGDPRRPRGIVRGRGPRVQVAACHAGDNDGAAPHPASPAPLPPAIILHDVSS